MPRTDEPAENRVAWPPRASGGLAVVKAARAAAASFAARPGCSTSDFTAGGAAEPVAGAGP
eukprot:4862420-Prymnesium_polylepis.1